MKIKLVFWLTLIAAAMSLSACTISITTKINPDDSGEYGIVFKITKA